MGSSPHGPRKRLLNGAGSRWRTRRCIKLFICESNWKMCWGRKKKSLVLKITSARKKKKIKGLLFYKFLSILT